MKELTEHATLLRWVAQAQAHDFEYSLGQLSGLSSHLPMAVIALARLGASDERLDEFGRRYSPRLRPFGRSADRVDAKNWRQTLGQSDLGPDYVAFFQREVQSRGRDATLRAYLPTLVPGVSGAAFHALIRLAYGLDAELDSEVTYGLAYWSVAYLELGEIPDCGVPCSEPDDLLSQVRQSPPLPSGAPSTGSGLIFDRMAEVASRPGFATYAGAFAPNDDALRRLALASARLFSATADFIALHAVTATHALRLALPYLGNEQRALRYFWQALLGAYVTIGCPELRATPLEIPEWNEIMTRAIHSNDEHVIKLVYTCSREEAHYRNELFQRIAAQKIANV